MRQPNQPTSPKYPIRKNNSVWESHSKRAAKKENGSHAYIRGLDGKRHEYLNEALPRNHLSHRDCKKPCKPGCPGDVIGPLESACCCRVKGACGHAYSHLMAIPHCKCGECCLQDIAALALGLQKQGIPLGWGSRERRIPKGKLTPQELRTLRDNTRGVKLAPMPAEDMPLADAAARALKEFRKRWPGVIGRDPDSNPHSQCSVKLQHATPSGE